MKNKVSILATAATLALIGASSGQTVIDITGSTAGRSAVITAVKALLDGETATWVGNDSETKANKQIYFGGTYGGQPVTVRMFWSGSAAGVRDISDAPQLDASYIVSNYAGAAGRNDTAALAAASAETVSEIGFSDVFQSSTTFTTNALADEVSVAVLPFVFMKNEGAPAGLTNMTPALFSALYGGLGELPLAIFTGVAADSAKLVYATGRNNESGTRITTVANCYYSLNLQINQYEGTVTDNVASINYVGNAGYSSGSSVATLLGGTLADTNTSMVGYLGISDGASAAALGASYMKFNGVDYTADNVQNGSYTQWGYLHQFTMLDLSAGGTTELFYDALKTQILNQPATSSTLPISSMNVERAADGATVTPLY